ncbi:YsnF/AvaK domain-containing protein [Desulfosporosinus nitroreducens]|uniref:YsnF/AvaK domain-containing protein n=1 Tax=Desulfosporosinus nitroreducens TaxID=2018668 RepID=UPI00207D5C88|nr:YsnF/AvaK domain-containing protein [Desulfosporosinus nitroreducens]MCO1603851.1 YsnF/AvaK domain-containing protein [Desulfosporosinus nitroreducens]
MIGEKDMAMNIPVDRESPTIDVTLQLKEEQLVLAKKWLQTGEVKIYRESLTEEKIFTLTVEYEELVIEKKLPVSAAPEQNEPPDVIRIRLSEEQVEFTKRMVSLEDVSIYKQQIEEIQHIEETLKREESAIRIFGSPKVRDDYQN